MSIKINSIIKSGKKPYTHLLTMMALVLFGLIALMGLGAATNYNYNGFELAKANASCVNGDVWISAGNHSGLPTSGYYYPQTYNTTYTLPTFDSIKWARLYIGVWGGTQYRTGYAATTLVNSAGSNLLGNETLDITSGSSPYAYCVGNGTWSIEYDVKDYLISGDSPTVSVYTVNNSQKFDGRVYAATLVVVYENSSMPCITYQINDGLVNLNNPNQVNTNCTVFDHVYCSYTNATATIVQIAGNAGQPDYAFFNPPYDVDNSPYPSKINWTKSQYTKYQLNSNDVANASSGSNYDLDVFTGSNDSTPLIDLVNKTGKNIIVFKRGHDTNNSGLIEAGFYDTVKEGESYVSPMIAVLKLDNRACAYDFSQNKWAFKYQVDALAPSTKDVPEEEFNATEYGQIAADDGVFASNTTTVDENYAAHRFVFNVGCCGGCSCSSSCNISANLAAINVTWDGKGWHDDGTDGANLYIWNGAGYELLASSSDADRHILTDEVTANLENYIDDYGQVTVLAEQKDFQSGEDKSHIETDYIKVVLKPKT